MDIRVANILGSATSLCIYLLCILIFVFRLCGKNTTEYYTGILFLLTALPLLFLLITARQFHRPVLYYVQISLMLLFIFAEAILDYILKADFRHTMWMVILYAMLFFAGTGGMIGVASLSGKTWSVVSIILFLVTGVLAFYQRSKTGM